MFGRLFKRDTVVRESFFRMALPGPWQSTFDPTAERWNFNTAAEQITVSLMGLASSLEATARTDLLQRMVLLRRQAELNVAAGVQLAEVVYASLGSVQLARYEGSGPEPGRLLTCLLMLNATILGTFYYEAVGLSLEEFYARGRSAFNSIQLAEAKGG